MTFVDEVNPGKSHYLSLILIEVSKQEALTDATFRGTVSTC